MANEGKGVEEGVGEQVMKERRRETHRNESRLQGQAERGRAGQCTLHSCPRSRR